MADIQPVHDWSRDYDIFAHDFMVDPYPVMSEIREGECPIAHSDRWGGSWLPTRYDDVVAMAQEHDVFTSRQIIVVPPVPGAGEGAYGAVAAPPITSDPPDHHWHRRLILPAFSPQSVATFEDGTRKLCHRLIDGFIHQGVADAAEHYAQQIPARVISAMLGVPVEMADEFTGWVQGALDLQNPKGRLEARMKILPFFHAQVQDRRANPRENDLITTLVQSVDDHGDPVTDTYVIGVCNLMLVAGVDTTWSSIGSALWHFAQHREHREQLRNQPSLWPMAIEELLRAYSPVTMARIVDRDIDFQGCPMKAGDRVLMAFPAANRDPRHFPNPDVVDFERAHNRHVAFGSGIHRCAGSNLARLELRVALQTWLERIREFELVDPGAVTWAAGQVRGPRHCLVRFPAATSLRN
jgi:cytochrome P450